MKCEPCIYSPEQAVGFLPTSFSDTSQLSLLSGINTPAMYLEPEQPMDGSLGCECGKVMSHCSIHPSTPDEWIASMRGSLAKTLVALEPVLESAQKHVADCTEKSCAWLTQYDQNGCFWKTSQTSIVPEQERFTETWPRSVMSSGQYAYALPMLERLTIGTGGGVSPDGMSFHHTPNTTGMDGESNSRKALKKRQQGLIFPTMTVNGNYNRKGITKTSGDGLITHLIQQGDSGRLNRQWVEWLMGWPLGHTKLERTPKASKRSVTGKSHFKPQPHSESLSSYFEVTL